MKIEDFAKLDHKGKRKALGEQIEFAKLIGLDSKSHDGVKDIEEYIKSYDSQQSDVEFEYFYFPKDSFYGGSIYTVKNTYMNGEKRDAEPLAGWLRNHHLETMRKKVIESADRFLSQPTPYDADLAAAEEIYTKHFKNSTLPTTNEFQGIKNNEIVFKLKDKIAESVSADKGIDVRNVGDLRTEKGWSKAKELADQFDSKRYGKAAEIPHSESPGFASNMYRLIDDLKHRPKSSSTKGLKGSEDEDDITLLGKKIRRR